MNSTTIQYQHATKVLRLASRDIETPSSELAYRDRLARKQIRLARIERKQASKKVEE